MSSFTAKEATKFFHSYEVKCDEKQVQEWMDDPYTKNTGSEVTEEDVWEYTDWSIRKGTAYEEGIDDKTKVKRLLMEVQRLEEENDKLREEKILLELELGISPFD